MKQDGFNLMAIEEFDIVNDIIEMVSQDTFAAGNADRFSRQLAAVFSDMKLWHFGITVRPVSGKSSLI
jgi:hypothetical protein